MKNKNTLAQCFLLFFCLCVLFPFFCLIIVSFRTPHSGSFTVQNYVPVFTRLPLIQFYANSMFIAVAQTVLQLIISILAAFAFARISFRAKKICFTVVKVSLFVPGVVTLIPLFFMTNALGGIDTYAGLIFPQLFCGLTTIMLTVYFSAVPQEVTDMGKLDGCNTLQLLYHLMIPQAASGIAAAALFAFFSHWKSYFWPLIITVSTNKRTLLIGMKYLIQEAAHEYHILSAAACVIIVPIVVLLFGYAKKITSLQRMILS